MGSWRGFPKKKLIADFQREEGEEEEEEDAMADAEAFFPSGNDHILTG